MAVVAVLAGGRSPEHEISLLSGEHVMRHISDRWRAWPVFLDRAGAWWPAPAPAVPGAAIPRGFRWAGMEPMRPGAALAFLLEEARADVVFPVLHGVGGEDGSVQGMLELHGVPFVGSGCAASAVAMDKIRTRECLAHAGLPMPRAYACPTPLASVPPEDAAREVERAVGFPCFLKVDTSGSTIGVQRAENAADVCEFVIEHRRMGRRFLAEQAIAGEEITVPVLGNSGGEVIALPAVGIYPKRDRYFTFAAKYTASLCEETVPPRGLDTKTIRLAQDLSVRSHVALQCDGFSRTDLIVGADGPMILEVNTIPGLTDVSLVPRAAAAAGIGFGELVDRLLDLALARVPGVEACR
jgi:D-alanine-D-alanine ligase